MATEGLLAPSAKNGGDANSKCDKARRLWNCFHAHGIDANIIVV